MPVSHAQSLLKPGVEARANQPTKSEVLIVLEKGGLDRMPAARNTEDSTNTKIAIRRPA